MILPKWLQELKDSHELYMYSYDVPPDNERKALECQNLMWRNIARLIRIAEVADELSLNFSWVSSTHQQDDVLNRGFDKLRAAQREDEKP